VSAMQSTGLLIAGIAAVTHRTHGLQNISYHNTRPLPYQSQELLYCQNLSERSQQIRDAENGRRDNADILQEYVTRPMCRQVHQLQHQTRPARYPSLFSHSWRRQHHDRLPQRLQTRLRISRSRKLPLQCDTAQRLSRCLPLTQDINVKHTPCPEKKVPLYFCHNFAKS